MTLSNDTNSNPEPQEGSDGSEAVQKRISQLTRARRDAERGRDAAVAERNVLMEQVQSLSAKIDQLARPAPAPTPAQPDPVAALLGKESRPAPAPAALQPPDIASMVRSAVQEAMGPLIQEQREAVIQQRLFATQQENFHAATEFLPELLIEGSQQEKLFNQIFEASPELQGMPASPLLVANAVAGILGNSRSPKQEDARKQAASPPLPSNPLQRLRTLPNAKTKEADVVRAFQEKAASEGLEKDELMTLVGLKLGRARLVEE